MKKAVISILLIVSLSAIVSAQSTDLPQMLVPSDYAREEASRLDVQVFKILPRHLLNKDLESAPRDSDYILGIRGNGAFYSFSTKTHSFNNIAEIYLTAGEPNRTPGELHLASNFGLMTDLGEYQLSKLTADAKIPALKLLSSYRPAITPQEREQEQKFHADARRAGIHLSTGGLPAILGHTYVVRSVRPEKADILVAYSIIRAEKHGSLEIAWKVLEQFIKPSLLYLSDVDLRRTLQQIIEAEGIFKTVIFEVKDSEIRLTGHTSKREYEIFAEAIRTIRIRQIHGNLVEDK